MASKLKRDQISSQKANNWKKSMKEEEKVTMNLKIPQIVLQKETYKSLAGENENRVRIYLGLEPVKENEKLELCAYAVSSFLLGSGDVYVDYETPVFKLDKQNIDFSSNAAEVIESIKRYQSWRMGELDADGEGAAVRQYIYPKAYLLTKFELHEIFNVQDKKEADIEFGISKKMDAMIITEVPESKMMETTAMEFNPTTEVYNNTHPCPPYCDDRSIYNS
jgi:hypothetical protein